MMDDNFRYKTINHSLHFIIKQLQNGKLTINPPFAIDEPWSNRIKSRFIESLILSIPTQPIWCEETPHGDYVVIDGSEKLKTLLEFHENFFSLESLRIRQEYNKLYFYQLPFHETVNLVDRYNFSFIVINYDNPPNLKCEFYRELFRDKHNFRPQAARNFAYPNAMGFIWWLRESSERYLSFCESTSLWRKIKVNDTRVDEFFLYLVTILMANTLSIDDFHKIGPDTSVEDLLDIITEMVDANEKLATEVGNVLLATLARMKTLSGDVIKVVVGRSLNDVGIQRDAISIRKFYEKFIDARQNKLDVLNSSEKRNPIIFSPRSPAKKLLHLIQSG